MATSIFPTPAIPYTRFATITSSGTWDHPDGYSSARPIRVICISGGGGGASGAARLSTTSVETYAGGGGASGLVSVGDVFISSQATITIGAGGTGGASVQRLGASGSGLTGGNAGTNGGDTIFSATGILVRSDVASAKYSVGSPQSGTGARTRAGCGGSAGGGSSVTAETNNAHLANGASFGNSIDGLDERYMSFGLNPIIYWTSGATANSTSFNPFFSQWASGGGGAGGTLSNGGITLNAGNGGYGFAGNNGAAGGAGSRITTANGTATATAGSSATNYGGGGGGGGAAFVVNASIGTATATSGAGGAGAPGVVYIYY